MSLESIFTWPNTYILYFQNVKNLGSRFLWDLVHQNAFSFFSKKIKVFIWILHFKSLFYDSVFFRINILETDGIAIN